MEFEIYQSGLGLNPILEPNHDNLRQKWDLRLFHVHDVCIVKDVTLPGLEPGMMQSTKTIRMIHLSLCLSPSSCSPSICGIRLSLVYRMFQSKASKICREMILFLYLLYCTVANKLRTSSVPIRLSLFSFPLSVNLCQSVCLSLSLFLARSLRQFISLLLFTYLSLSQPIFLSLCLSLYINHHYIFLFFSRLSLPPPPPLPPSFIILWLRWACKTFFYVRSRNSAT